MIGSNIQRIFEKKLHMKYVGLRVLGAENVNQRAKEETSRHFKSNFRDFQAHTAIFVTFTDT